jgi:DNA-binding XRE family transcriptional regulator
MEVKNTLRKHRNKLGLTQEDVARAVDITLSYYQRCEYGTSFPTVPIAQRLAGVFGCEIDDLWPRGDSDE